jgi:hypothetical protein
VLADLGSDREGGLVVLPRAGDVPAGRENVAEPGEGEGDVVLGPDLASDGDWWRGC